MKKVLSMVLVLAMMLSLVTVTTVASTAEQVTTGKEPASADQLATAGAYDVESTETDAITIADDVTPATAVPMLFGTQETAPQGEKQKVRLVALIDSLKYDTVGFKVTSQVDGGNVKNYGSLAVTTAYLSAKAGDKVITANDANKVLGTNYEYLYTLTFKNVPTTGKVVFTAQPYAKTSTETMIGDEYEVTYQNGKFVSIELAEKKIPMSDLAKYVIIRPNNSTDATISLADRLKASVNALEGGASCIVKADPIIPGFLMYQEQEYEILIGDTNRAQTLAYKKTLRGDDYGYTLIDKKIVIFGFNDETLEKAIDLFISQVLSDTALSDGVLFAESDAVTKEGEYRTNHVTVGNTSIKDCVIVYPKDDANAKTRAQDLEAFLLDSVGFWVPVQSDETAHQDGVYEILIGKTNREEQAPDDLDEHTTYIVSGDKATLVGGADATGIFYACTLFKQMFVTQESSLKVEIETPISENADAEMLRVMSFNLQTSPSTERLEAGIAVIKKYAPSILGVQEANPAWMEALRSGLTEYDCVGVGRGANLSGEHCAIFYKKDEFTLLESDTKWLSDTPDVPGSKYENAGYARIATWVLLERKSDGKKFLYVNTHLCGDPVNLKQFKVIMDLIQEYNCDTLITGDFNTRASSATYTYIQDQGYQDSLHQAETFHATSEFPSIENYNGRRVDYIWIKANSSYVSDYHVIREYINGTQPSDHPMIYVDMLLP